MTQRLRAIFASILAGILNSFVLRTTQRALPTAVSGVSSVVALLVARTLGRGRCGHRRRRLGGCCAARRWHSDTPRGPGAACGGPAPSLDLAMCGPPSGARTTPLARLWPPGQCWCSRAAARVLSATGPLLARTGTGNSAPDEPITVIVFFLGAMATKNC